MKLIRYQQPEVFYKRVNRYLLRPEAENNLPLRFGRWERYACRSSNDRASLHAP